MDGFTVVAFSIVLLGLVVSVFQKGKDYIAFLCIAIGLWILAAKHISDNQTIAGIVEILFGVILLVKAWKSRLAKAS